MSEFLTMLMTCRVNNIRIVARTARDGRDCVVHSPIFTCHLTQLTKKGVSSVHLSMVSVHTDLSHVKDSVVIRILFPSVIVSSRPSLPIPAPLTSVEIPSLGPQNLPKLYHLTQYFAFNFSEMDVKLFSDKIIQMAQQAAGIVIICIG